VKRCTLACGAQVLSGACDDIPENAFCMIGGMADVRDKAAKLALAIVSK